MTTHSTRKHLVPSEEFWTVTPFAFETPDGWQARQTVDHLAYMDVEGEDGTNCGIQWKRISPKLDLRQIAQMSHAVTRRIDPEVKVGLSRYGNLNGRMSYLRISEFDVQRNGAAVKKGQLYSTWFGPRFGPERPVELFELTGHFDVEHAGRLEEIREILGSFRFMSAPRSVVDAATA